MGSRARITIEGKDVVRLRNALGMASGGRLTAHEIVVRCEMMRNAVAQAADKELIEPPAGLWFSAKPNGERTR